MAPLLHHLSWAPALVSGFMLVAWLNKYLTRDAGGRARAKARLFRRLNRLWERWWWREYQVPDDPDAKIPAASEMRVKPRSYSYAVQVFDKPADGQGPRKSRLIFDVPTHVPTSRRWRFGFGVALLAAAAAGWLALGAVGYLLHDWLGLQTPFQLAKDAVRAISG